MPRSLCAHSSHTGLPLLRGCPMAISGDGITLNFPAEAPWPAEEPDAMTATVCNMLCIPASAISFVGRNRLDAFVRFCRRLYALLHSKCAYNVLQAVGIADMHTHTHSLLHWHVVAPAAAIPRTFARTFARTCVLIVDVY